MKKWVIGNWKLNPSNQVAAKDLATNLSTAISDTAAVNVAVVPSFVHLSLVGDVLKPHQILLGVQDVAWHDDVGAFTGDVSAAQVADLGATLTLIGHSERRCYHHEDNAILAKKIVNAQKAGLTVVLCVGESQSDYQKNNTLSVLDEQLAVLDNLSATLDGERFVIAYEPVWAIGTGLVPTIDDVEKVHRHIKQRLCDKWGMSVAVLYGGSVNQNNVAMFADSAVVDGVLVGGASLQADSFAAIAWAFVA